MVIISRKSGRLGNRILSFAHYMANAMEYQYTVISPVFDEYAKYFVGSSTQLLSQYPLRRLNAAPTPAYLIPLRKIIHYLLYSVTNPFRRDRIAWLNSPWHEVIDLHHPAVYDWRNTDFLSFVRRKWVISNGWIFWDHENFLKHHQAIRDYFRLSPEYAEKVQSHVAKCRQPGRPLIGIHMRRGDYKNFADGKFYYYDEQYLALMNRLSEQFPVKPVFMLCSEDPPDPAAFAPHQITTGLGDSVEDMYCLSACDYIVGPPSTFSAWASFMGQTPLHFLFDMEHSCAKVALADFQPIDSYDYLSPTHRFQH